MAPPLLKSYQGHNFNNRIPISEALQFLNQMVEMTGDEEIGLRAAQSTNMGDFDVVEYAAGSSNTLREAIDVIIRYIKLIDDSANFSLEERDGIASLHLDSVVNLNRAAIDFRSGVIYIFLRQWLKMESIELTEMWFQFQQPERIDKYYQFFGNTRIRFQMPTNAVLFEASLLDTSLSSADPKLHKVLCEHAETLLSSIPKSQSLTERVQTLIEEELPKGKTNAEHIAGILDMSRRTLTRRLEQEGTTYKTLLDDLRRQLAIRYLETTKMDMSEIALLLGFSQTPAFHRAFRRWTDYSPLKYRRAIRR